MTRSESKGWLHLPMEVKVRELHGKVLLAIEAAHSGFDVVLGAKAELYRMPHRLPPGVVLHISSEPQLLEVVEAFRVNGHKTITLDEEALAYPDDEMYVRARLSKEVIGRTDAVLCWGNHHAGLVKQKTNGTDCQVLVTGNPRFDLLRPEFRATYASQVSDIQREYGRFILVNTNFSFCNPKLGKQGYQQLLQSKGVLEDPVFHDYTARRIAWKQRIFDAFTSLLPELSQAFPNHHIIVRPHPSENHDYWRESMASFPRIKVVHSGNVVAWILAAELLIENSCTTAVEAFVVGTPTVAYRPFVEARMEAPITQLVCTEASSKEELFSAAAQAIGSEIQRDSQHLERLKHHLENLNGDTAVGRIVRVLLEMGAPPRSILRERTLRLAPLVPMIRHTARNLIGRPNPKRQQAYQEFKFPGLETRELHGLLAAISSCTKNTVPLNVHRVGESCYHLRRN